MAGHWVAVMARAALSCQLDCHRAAARQVYDYYFHLRV